MFKLKNTEPDKPNTMMKVKKIKALLQQTLFSIRNGESFKSEKQDCKLRKSKDSSTEPEYYQEVLNKLRQGYLVLKHSRNTKEPHKKVVYLSEDLKHLCWKSIGKDDEKSFPLSSIVKTIRKGCRSALRRDISLIEQSRTLVIFSTERNLQLEAATQFEADSFMYELNRVIKHSKKMSQNYLYSFN